MKSLLRVLVGCLIPLMCHGEEIDELIDAVARLRRSALRAEREGDARRAAELWKESEARWITGRGNVNAEWDAYVARLKSMGVDRYVEIHQAAEDRYLAAQR